MQNRGGADALVEVRAEVQQVCDLLCDPSPATVDRCAAVVRSAISRLGEWRQRFQEHDKAANRQALGEALRLRVTVRRAGRLLEAAAQYHAGWRRSLGSLCAGYGPSGAPAAAARPGHLCLRG